MNLKHGQAKIGRVTPEYSAWGNAIQRCENPRDKGFKNYGARGISMREPYRGSFASFLADLGPRPSPKHSLDRIDNDRDYEPGNCRWATWSEQMKNRRATAYGHSKPAAKLSPEQIVAIRADPRSGAAIAADYGISRSHANDLKRGKYWGPSWA